MGIFYSGSVPRATQNRATLPPLLLAVHRYILPLLLYADDGPAVTSL